MAEFPGRQRIIQGQRADPVAVQAFHVVADGGDHPFDLVIATFGDGQVDHSLSYGLDGRRAGNVIFTAQRQPEFQLPPPVIAQGFRQGDPVGLGAMVSGRGDAMAPLAVGGQ